MFESRTAHHINQLLTKFAIWLLCRKCAITSTVWIVVAVCPVQDASHLL